MFTVLCKTLCSIFPKLKHCTGRTQRLLLLSLNGLRIFQTIAPPEKHKRLGMNRGDRREHYLWLKIPLVLKWKMEIDQDQYAKFYQRKIYYMFQEVQREIKDKCFFLKFRPSIIYERPKLFQFNLELWNNVTDLKGIFIRWGNEMDKGV